jgi:hypothetical protein
MRFMNSDTPRHQRPLWEVCAFLAAIIGLMAVAQTAKSVKKMAKSATTPAAATAGYSAQD